MKKFTELELDEALIVALEKMGIKEPTDIQNKMIPLVKENKNIIGQSQTGTGKTLAYLLPIIEKIDINKKEMQAIILAPTHELAVQINNTILDLKKNSNKEITSTTLVGSGNITRQIEKLKSKPHIIVGSSGRILELIKKKKVSAHTIKTLVIDEGDKLLDYMNIESVNAIIKSCQRDIQKILVSATLVTKTFEVAKKVIGNCEIVQSVEENKVNSDIEHGYFLVEHREKVDTLRKLIYASKAKKTIVFINKNYDVNMTLSKLRFHKIKAEALHGTNKKEERKNALEGFRKGDIQVLIASDIAARGLDIKGVTHIINLDIPEDNKDYLHRVGRVGRAGEKGTAYSLVDKRELPLINEYENKFKVSIPQMYIYEGEVNIEPKKKVYKKYKSKDKKDNNKKKKTKFKKN
ncbi:DEAD/DEAH box helicase [Clostridium tarantellae]|uniref:DEAD/DEAH box helicase n=1 Tax=Clostridium tarantellae TaxID=39493 RepID=A0A6I1MQM3_9CLOT|nr:DEAD/DEAH box helicase [Clostridium tarantellae]MPQ45040.1 DEAD/DEAH box helicase [Clostridium tarantellae]